MWVFDPRMWILLVAGVALGYFAGYMHKGSIDRAQEAAEEKAPAVAGTVIRETVMVTDKVAVAALEARVKDWKDKSDDLQRQIQSAKDAARASVDCRLPAGLRDAINRDLTSTGAP